MQQHYESKMCAGLGSVALSHYSGYRLSRLFQCNPCNLVIVCEDFCFEGMLKISMVANLLSAHYTSCTFIPNHVCPHWPQIFNVALYCLLLQLCSWRKPKGPKEQAPMILPDAYKPITNMDDILQAVKEEATRTLQPCHLTWILKEEPSENTQVPFLDVSDCFVSFCLTLSHPSAI